jgi:hypothetical protein
LREATEAGVVRDSGIVLAAHVVRTYMKKSDYAHLGAKARLEQLQEEIAATHKAFPGLKHTTPLTAPLRRAGGKRRAKAKSSKAKSTKAKSTKARK